jgi:TetR/AcrR family transcriptional regulator, transcriptional repressor for nem operon
MQTRSKNRKEEIVEVAAELLQTQGFESFSYRHLSERLGITKASIHHHFPKKDDLGVALCEWILQWHELKFAKIRNTPGTAWDKLQGYLTITLSCSEGANKICPLSSLQSDINALPESMREALRKLDEHELTFIAQILREGRDSGELNFPGDTYHQAVLFVLACKGALQYTRVHGPSMFEDTMSQFELLLKG